MLQDPRSPPLPPISQESRSRRASLTPVVKGVPLLTVPSASPFAVMVGVVALLIAIVGSVAGLGSYVLYSADAVSSDNSANLILASVLCSLIAAPIGYAGSRSAQKRHQQPVLAQAGMFLALGTLGAWVVVVAVALGK